MAAGALQWASPGAQLERVWARLRPAEAAPARRPAAGKARGTPEIYFTKTIDNSRLVRIADPQRAREMLLFTASCCLLFAMTMFYAWQHFSAVEYGYRIEARKAERDQLVELNRELQLEEAALRDPERIDRLARRLGLGSPDAGQMLRLDRPAAAEPAEPVLARTTPATEFPAAR